MVLGFIIISNRMEHMRK